MDDQKKEQEEQEGQTEEQESVLGGVELEAEGTVTPPEED